MLEIRVFFWCFLNFNSYLSKIHVEILKKNQNYFSKPSLQYFVNVFGFWFFLDIKWFNLILNKAVLLICIYTRNAEWNAELQILCYCPIHGKCSLRNQKFVLTITPNVSFIFNWYETALNHCNMLQTSGSVKDQSLLNVTRIS